MYKSEVSLKIITVFMLECFFYSPSYHSIFFDSAKFMRELLPVLKIKLTGIGLSLTGQHLF